ncbi:protein abnormal spindle-like isoform X3 [Sipha flava]|uniref:Protein abnormal spindle-like isoform X3 n=1 Tax=Sipha flava TaxID=143950 RepID=A0A8B8GGY7_9HEMI|nr:protein abnormal spindle-like isoform X3 [Sipha flava]
MSKFVVEFSPPVKIKSNDDDINTVFSYNMILAPFQKQTQIEFANVKIKEEAVRFLTVINPLDKPRQFALPHLSDGIRFNIYDFTLQPHSQHELSITWQPLVYGNMRKTIKLEQKDSNIKYDFVIMGNCIDTLNKKLKGASITYSKSKNSNLIRKQLNCGQKKITLNKTKVTNYKSERIILGKNDKKKSKLHCPESSIDQEIRRETFLINDKENYAELANKIFDEDICSNIIEHNFKYSNKKFQDHDINNHFEVHNLNMNRSIMSNDSLDGSLQIIDSNKSPFNDFYLTPLKNTKNLLSPFSTTKKCKKNDNNLAFASFSPSPFKPIEASTGAKTFTPDERKPKRISVNLCNKFEDPLKNDTNKDGVTFIKDVNPGSVITPINIEQNFNLKQQEWSTGHTTLHHSIISGITPSSKKSKRPSFVIKNSPYYKCSPKSLILKNKLKQHSFLSPRTKRLRTPKLDKCDQYLKCLANPELVYFNNAEDPFLKMSQYYETEWLDRQESDMIRWLNALLMPTDKLADEEQSDDLEQAAEAWVEASQTNHRNKPLQLATQKDLFVAQIYRQSPQQWSALRKATSNLITSTNVATVLSKLTVSIEKDLITVRDDRQIHLDLNLKKKITDLLKCYNPLWLRIGLEAIYGQVVLTKPGSNDLDGIGWFIRKHLFNNDFVKQKFTKTNVLQVNFPSYNIAMKKFILRKILMLIYFLDRAKEQHLIRHNPCLFKIDSPYKSSYDFLMGFCADMVTAHGDIIRRLRNIDYNLTHKQTHLDEVNYAVKSLNDLRDGTRITRVVEILFKGEQLSQKLRLPAISKLQKIHNVNLALTRISEHINIEGNINTRDIVNGHREKILSLFWQIIYKYLTPRYNNAALKIQHWWRNNSLKLVILKRIRTKQSFKRNLAAIKIQACVRGYLTRKYWPGIQADLNENRQKLHLASTKIKRYLQNKLKLLTEERKRFIILKRTTLFVQRKFRLKIAMKKERQQFLLVKQSILLIQKVYRGFIIRKNWPLIKKLLIDDKIKRINAINIIKRSLRKNLPPTEDELFYKKLIFMTLKIQRKFRANILMKNQMKDFLILKKNAIVLQRRFRAKQAMIDQKKYYLKLKICTLKLQAVIRGFIVRKHWPTLYSKLQKNKMNLITSSNIIKRALRRNLPVTEDRIQFLRLKSSAIVLQNRFRAKQEMKKQRKLYLLLKTVTIKLQSIVRGYLLRKQWPELRNKLQKNRTHLIDCSNIIKKCLRKNLPVSVERMEFIQVKSAAIVFQRRFRAIKMMKEDREKYIKMKANTIKLQSIVRGYIIRKQWPELRIKLQANKNYLINCSNIIKRTLRKNIPVTEDQIKFIRLKKSTIFIQRKFRATKQMQKLRKQYLQIKIMTLRLQSVARGYIFRKQWISLKNELMANRQHLINCSNIIKRVMRKNLPTTESRLRFLELRRAVITVQTKFRVNKQVKNYRTLRNNVILIQRKFRANMAMKQQKQIYENKKKITIRLQAYFRGYLVRKKWPETKCVLKAYQNKLITSSNIIKKFLRQSLPPTKERLRFLKLRQSVIKVQSRYRAIVAMKLAEREYLLQKESVITLQRYYRAYKAMVKQRRQYEHLKKSSVLLQSYVRRYLALKHWPQLKNSLETRRKRSMEALEKQNMAALKIQAAVRGYFVRKKLPLIKYELQIIKLVRAATLIQALWRGYSVRKKYQCRRETIRVPKKGALTLGKRHNDAVDVLNRQKKNEYSYRELTTVFWNLEICTSLSKELCLKTAEGIIVDIIFHFLQYSNQSQPSIEAREPAIRVLINLLRYKETSWHIWVRTVNADIVKDLIKMLKTCCGKICSNKLYCSVATWLWIALQDPKKKLYIKNIPTATVDLKIMMDTLSKKYKTHKVEKSKMVLPSTRPTWSIGSKCQKCFDSDLYATVQICKLLNIPIN